MEKLGSLDMDTVKVPRCYISGPKPASSARGPKFWASRAALLGGRRPLSLFIYQIPLLTCSKLEGGGPGYKEPSSVLIMGRELLEDQQSTERREGVPLVFSWHLK